MNRNELKVEDILEDDDLVLEIKTNASTQFAGCFSGEVVRRLIDYATKEPQVDDLKIGHKYPFNACELLCSDNGFILDRVLEEIKVSIEEDDGKDSKKSSDENENENEEDEAKQGKMKEEHNEALEMNNEDMVNQDENIESRNVVKISEAEEQVNVCKDTEILTEKQSDGEEKNPEKDTQEQLPVEHNAMEIVNEKETIESDNRCTAGETSEDIPPHTDTENISQQSSDQPATPASDVISPSLNPPQSQPHHQKSNALTEDIFREDEENEILSISQEHIDVPQKEDESRFKLVYETLDYFYSFLDSKPDELNYVLAGYFYKIFSHLMNVKGSAVIKYLFSFRQDILQQMIIHANRKAIGECLHRILIFSGDDVNNTNEIKVDLTDCILSSIQDTDDSEKVDVITELLMDCLGNKKFYFLFMTNERLLRRLHLCAVGNLQKTENIKCILKLLIKINENILKDFGSQVTPVFSTELPGDLFSIINIDIPISLEDDTNANANANDKLNFSEIKNHLESIIGILSENSQIILEDFASSSPESETKEFISTYDKPQKILGLKKLAELEYLRTTIDVLINGFAANLYEEKLTANLEMLIEKGIFRYAISTFFEYEMNNMYQKLFEQLIVLSTNASCPEMLVKHLYMSGDNDGGCNFLVRIKDHLEKCLKFEFCSGRVINSGHLAILCEVAYHISMSSNKCLKEIIQNDHDFKLFYQIFIEPVKARFTQRLLQTNASQGKVISNLDTLNTECEGQETLGKEIEILPSEKSLKETIAENLLIYELHNRGDPLDDHQNPIEEDHGENDLDNANVNEMNRKNSIEDLINGVTKQLDNQENIIEESSKEDDRFFDNIYWKSNNFPCNETVIRELLNELEL